MGIDGNQRSRRNLTYTKAVVLQHTTLDIWLRHEITFNSPLTSVLRLSQRRGAGHLLAPASVVTRELFRGGRVADPRRSWPAGSAPARSGCPVELDRR